MPGPNELGDFLRARRARLRPGDVGLPPGPGTRRTPGLRREETAALAGLSIDYYIRLEQGKETNPSGPILDGLARALWLNEEEHAHLYALANHAAGRTAGGPPPASRVVRPGVRQLLETVRPCPAYVLTRTSDLLAANPEALALFPGLADWPPERRNTIRYTFFHPAARELFAHWDHSAETIAAHLRSLAADAPDDPEVSALIGRTAAARGGQAVPPSASRRAHPDQRGPLPGRRPADERLPGRTWQPRPRRADPTVHDRQRWQTRKRLPLAETQRPHHRASRMRRLRECHGGRRNPRYTQLCMTRRDAGSRRPAHEDRGTCALPRPGTSTREKPSATPPSARRLRRQACG